MFKDVQVSFFRLPPPPPRKHPFLFKVYWNNALVFDTQGMYPWYAHYLNRYKETPGVMRSTSLAFPEDNKDLDSKFTRGGGDGERVLSGYDGEFVLKDFQDRCLQFSEGKVVELCFPFLWDLFYQPKFISDKIEMKIVLIPASPLISLYADGPNPDSEQAKESEQNFFSFPPFF